jgi:hypothetical protein
MDEHEDIAIAGRVRALGAELPVALPPIGPVMRRARRRHDLAFAGTMLAAIVLAVAVAVPLHSLIALGGGQAPAGIGPFDPLRAAPRPCPDGFAGRSGGTPTEFAQRLRGHLPTWLPDGFGLLRSNGLGRAPFGVWSDSKCDLVLLRQVRGLESGLVSTNIQPVGSWLRLIDAPGGCAAGAARCFDYETSLGAHALLLHTQGLDRAEADRVATGIAAARAQRSGPFVCSWTKAPHASIPVRPLCLPVNREDLP